MDRTRCLGQTLLIAVRSDIAHAITQFGNTMSHGAEYELGLGPVVAPATEDRGRLDDDDLLLWILWQEMIAQLLPE